MRKAVYPTIGLGLTILALVLIPVGEKSIWWLGLSRGRWAEIGIVVFIWLGTLWGLKILTSIQAGDRTLAFLSSGRIVRMVIETGLAAIAWGIILLLAFGIYLIIEESSWKSAAVRAAPLVLFSGALLPGFIQNYLKLANQTVSLGSRTFGQILFFSELRKTIRRLIQDLFGIPFSFLNARITSLAESVNVRLLVMTLVLLPAVGTIVFLWFGLDSRVNDFFPRSFDDVDYWRETTSFVTHGFSFGPYSVDEQTAPAEFSNFGAHGPAFPIFYGMFGKLIGWQPYSAVWLNLGLFTVGMAGFLWFARPNRKQMLALLAVELTFWPAWLYLPRNMQEIVHYSAGLVIAGIWAALLMGRGDKRKNIWMLIGLICLISLMRFTWSVILLGPLVLLWGRGNKKSLWLRWGAVAVLFLASAALFKYWNVPWPTFSFRFFNTLANDPAAAGKMFLVNFQGNVMRFLYHPEDNWYVMLFRYQVILLIGYTGRQIWRNWQKDTQKLIESLSIGILLAPVLGLVVSFNDVVDRRDYRNLAPHVLIALLLLVMTNRHRWVYFMAILSLTALPSVVEQFSSYSNDYQSQTRLAASANLADEWEGIVYYDPDGGKWCNSLLIEYGTLSEDGGSTKFPPSLFALTDPGIGVGLAIDWHLLAEKGLKSKYIFADPAFIAQKYPGAFDKLSLKPAATYGNGTLFINLGSGCMP